MSASSSLLSVPPSPVHGASPSARPSIAHTSSAFGTLFSYWKALGSDTMAGLKGAGHSVTSFSYGHAARSAWQVSWIRAPYHTFQLVAQSRGPYAERLQHKPVVRALLDRDFKTQFVGRMGVQFGVGVGYGVSALVLGMSGTMGASQGMLAADLVRGLEILLHQGSSMWRGIMNDRTRAERESAEQTTDATERAERFRIPRHRFVCVLDTAWVAEVLCCAALVGVALGRQAAFMSTRGLIVVLAVIRAARVVCSQAQYAQFDSLRETVRSADTRAIIVRNRDFLRNLEQVVGFGINYSVGIGVQALPTLVPCPALIPVMVGLLGLSVAVSFLTKQPARRYYQERFDVTRPNSGANTPRPHQD